MIVAMGVLTACTTPTAPTTGAAPDAVGGGASAGPSHGAAATGGPSSQPTDSPAADGTAGTPTDGSGTASPTQPAKAAGTMTLSFAGDVHFERQVRALLTSPEGMTALRPVLGAADVTVVNLESAITDRGSPEPKEFHFRAPPSALQTLADAGVDVVSMANNHAVDFGPVGLGDTLAAKAASPVPVIGIGADAKAAFAPAVVTVDGLRVAVIASTQVPDLTAAKFPAGDSTPGVAANQRPERLLAAVRAARAAYDVVVVFLHWGTEQMVCPDGAQLATAAALEAAGADIIVGGHAHRVQGAGWLGRAYVDYGLGNFVWWLNSTTPKDSASGVLTVTVDEAAVRARAALPRAQWAGLGPVVSAGRWVPLRISRADGLPKPPGVDEAARMSADWEQARACTKLEGSP